MLLTSPAFLTMIWSPSIIGQFLIDFFNLIDPPIHPQNEGGGCEWKAGIGCRTISKR